MIGDVSRIYVIPDEEVAYLKCSLFRDVQHFFMTDVFLHYFYS